MTQVQSHWNIKSPVRLRVIPVENRGEGRLSKVYCDVQLPLFTKCCLLFASVTKLPFRSFEISLKGQRFDPPHSRGPFPVPKTWSLLRGVSIGFVEIVHRGAHHCHDGHICPLCESLLQTCPPVSVLRRYEGSPLHQMGRCWTCFPGVASFTHSKHVQNSNRWSATGRCHAAISDRF